MRLSRGGQISSPEVNNSAVGIAPSANEAIRPASVIKETRANRFRKGINVIGREADIIKRIAFR